MVLRILAALSSRCIVFALFCGLVSVAAHGQTNVEIEVAGPWSYVQDPNDVSRVIIIAPELGHILAVFKGDNAFDYSSDTEPPAGTHRLDFSTATCNSPSPSNHYLYPLNGIAQKTITDALSSASVYSLSLPKPCFYENKLESRFKYNAIQKVTQADEERSFTTWMILHYTVADPTIPADLDKGTGSASKIQFGTNIGSNKNAISLTLYVDLSIGPDTKCDSHSAAIFDASLDMWKMSNVYRAFPQLKDLIFSNQQLRSYDYTCKQDKADSSNMFVGNRIENQRRKATLSHPTKRVPKAPGRADCHAAQINVNGVVN
jgi:hypothetical protein